MKQCVERGLSQLNGLPLAGGPTAFSHHSWQLTGLTFRVQDLEEPTFRSRGFTSFWLWVTQLMPTTLGIKSFHGASSGGERSKGR